MGSNSYYNYNIGNILRIKVIMRAVDESRTGYCKSRFIVYL